MKAPRLRQEIQIPAVSHGSGEASTVVDVYAAGWNLSRDWYRTWKTHVDPVDAACSPASGNGGGVRHRGWDNTGCPAHSHLMAGPPRIKLVARFLALLVDSTGDSQESIWHPTASPAPPAPSSRKSPATPERGCSRCLPGRCRRSRAVRRSGRSRCSRWCSRRRRLASASRAL